jgi:HEAT repeat protein
MAFCNRQTLFLASQIGLLCLSVMVVPPRLVQGETSKELNTTQSKPSTLASQIRQFANQDRSDMAIAALKRQGAPAIATLSQMAKNQKEPLKSRLFAIALLGQFGKEAKSAVPALIQAANDPNKAVRLKTITAIANIKSEAKSAVPELTQHLTTPDREIRLATINSLGKFGSDATAAVPMLAQALEDPDPAIRTATATTLRLIGKDASQAVPQLIRSLHHPDRNTRSLSAQALGLIGDQAAVSALTEALKDPSSDVKGQSAAALGRIGLEARSALPELVKLLNDENQTVRLNIAFAIGEIAGELQDKAATLSASEINTVYTTLESALPVLVDPQAQPNEAVVVTVRRSLSVLKNEKDSRLFERLFEWTQANPAFAGILLYMLSMPSLWFAVLLIRPLWLLKINNGLQPYTDFEVPSPLGGSIKIPIRFVLFVGWFHYHPRVLDAWVTRQIDVAREAFAHKSTVSDRKVYIPIPVVMDGSTVAELASQDLHTTFWDGRQCLLIWGEGGIGKTSLACHLAKWAMADNRQQRLSRHRMLPVLIEQELDFKLGNDKDPFREAIRGQLQALIDAAEPISDEFLEKLLRQRRILVIVDRLSELSEDTRQQIRPGHPDFPANALIVTSRVEETLDEVPKTTVKPLRIEGNRLSSFLEAYLMQRGKRELFTDPEYFDACSQLSKMVGHRNITVLLAKLYAEQMIAKKDGSEDSLPDNIPDLMLSYLNELNRDVTEEEPNNLTVHGDAKIIAWECLKHYYRPAPAKREAILEALQAQTGADEEAVKPRLKHLEKRLRIVQAIGPAQDQICFALDPLAECLAALHLVELYGNNQDLWDDWLIQADAMPGAPESIQGFLLAMRDCCLTRSAEIDVPDSVLEALGQRVGLSAETLRKSQIEQRMRRLTPLLSTGNTATRLDAIRELGELGPAAKGVLPALIREFQDRDWAIRREVARAIGQIGPDARSAIPALVERLRDDDRRVSAEAIASLGKLGTSSLPALIAALDAKPAYVRSSAAWVLATFNSFAKPAVPALTTALKDEDWQVRWVAAYTLGCIGPEAKPAIPALIEAFRGEYELVSKEASRTLWRISGEAEAIVTALGGMQNGNDRN